MSPLILRVQVVDQEHPMRVTHNVVQTLDLAVTGVLHRDPPARLGQERVWRACTKKISPMQM
jgi:hypothetical protein